MICFLFLIIIRSIVACGVLNRNILTANPARNQTTNANRRNSLIKYQIDSSEYVQPKIDESLMRSYTDYEKAMHNEYKLNIFSTVSSYISSETSPGQSDDEREQAGLRPVDDELITIKTAHTKNDWIQEWAKNARRCNNMFPNTEAVSPNLQLSSKTMHGPMRFENKHNNRITQSCSTSDQFGDGIDDNINDECMARKTDQMKNGKGTESSRKRPPISPTKIPSPMHTQLRLRSSSVNRSFRHSNAVS